MSDLTILLNQVLRRTASPLRSMSAGEPPRLGVGRATDWHRLKRFRPEREDTMRRQIVVGLVAGVTFLVLDGVLNANPLAQRLYDAYGPIARPSVNVLAGSAIDLAYGVILAALFFTLWPSLPGRTSLMKGLWFGIMVWFFRVFMKVAGEWLTTTVPASTHAYTLVAGLVQVLLVVGVIALLLPQPHTTGAT